LPDVRGAADVDVAIEIAVENVEAAHTRGAGSARARDGCKREGGM
jgi:hypothetical protein